MIISSKLVRNILFINNFAKFCTQTDSLPIAPTRGTATYFYKRSLQRLTNVKGTFTQHHLIRLTKLSRKLDDIDLLFEGFYNYLGRNAQLSSQTIDKMFIKIIQILKNNPQVVKDTYFDKMYNVLVKHEYFSYYPSYEITSSILQIFGEPEKYKKIMFILRCKPLIKLDEKCFEILISKLAVFQLQLTKNVFKLICYRLSYMSLHDIDFNGHKKLLISCMKRLSQRKDIHILQHNPYLGKWLKRNFESFKQHPQQQLGYALAMGDILNRRVGSAYKALKQIPKITLQGQSLFNLIKVLKDNNSNIQFLLIHKVEIESLLKQKSAPQSVQKLAKSTLST